MLWSPRKNGLDSLFKEVWVSKVLLLIGRQSCFSISSNFHSFFCVPKGPKIEKLNLAWKFQSRLRTSIPHGFFNPHLQSSPQKKNRGLVGGSLENFNLAWNFQSQRAILNFFNLWALRGVRKVADVWKKDVWEFQAKSGSSGSCRLFLHFLGKIAVRKTSGRTSGSPRHPSCRHPRPSEVFFLFQGF